MIRILVIGGTVLRAFACALGLAMAGAWAITAIWPGTPFWPAAVLVFLFFIRFK